MRCMGRAEWEVKVEGTLGNERDLVPNHFNGLIDQILGKVITVLGPRGRIDHVIVCVKLGMKLIGLALHKTVEAIEASL